MLKLDTRWRRALLAAAALTVATNSTLHEDVFASAPREGDWVGSWATAVQGVVDSITDGAGSTDRSATNVPFLLPSPGWSPRRQRL